MTLYFRWYLWNFSHKKNGHDRLGQLRGSSSDDNSTPAEKLSTSMTTTNIGFIRFFPVSYIFSESRTLLGEAR